MGFSKEGRIGGKTRKLWGPPFRIKRLQGFKEPALAICVRELGYRTRTDKDFLRARLDVFERGGRTTS